MFTGIIEETGRVKGCSRSQNGIRLEIQTRSAGKDLKLGSSLAVNGCCLTIVQISGRRQARLISADILEETWKKTNFRRLSAGSLVNLERPLKAEGRLDGHWVSGHIDGVGKITRWAKDGRDWRLEVAPPQSLMKYLVAKGSVALDGISLTVAQVLSRRFRVWIIPRTLETTNLREAVQGGYVNLETDILGKYAERLLEGRQR